MERHQTYGDCVPWQYARPLSGELLMVFRSEAEEERSSLDPGGGLDGSSCQEWISSENRIRINAVYVRS